MFPQISTMKMVAIAIWCESWALQQISRSYTQIVKIMHSSFQKFELKKEQELSCGQSRALWIILIVAHTNNIVIGYKYRYNKSGRILNKRDSNINNRDVIFNNLQTKLFLDLRAEGKYWSNIEKTFSSLSSKDIVIVSAIRLINTK